MRNYTIGFIFSIVLTLAAYFSVTRHLFHGPAILAIILAAAFIQVFVQLIFFLDLDAGSRWDLTVLVSTASVIFILVGGSLWIMRNLNRYHLPPPTQSNIIQDEGLH